MIVTDAAEKTPDLKTKNAITAILEKRTIFGALKNNEDRRLGIERRKFLYTVYIPERRMNKDRRNRS